MSLAALKSRALAGLDEPEVTVEVHLAGGLATFTKLGANLLQMTGDYWSAPGHLRSLARFLQYGHSFDVIFPNRSPDWSFHLFLTDWVSTRRGDCLIQD